jgi:hypothetical protein
MLACFAKYTQRRAGRREGLAHRIGEKERIELVQVTTTGSGTMLSEQTNSNRQATDCMFCQVRIDNALGA